MTERRRWWLAGVAAVMAALYLYQNVGWDATLLLAAGCAIGFGGYRFLRARRPPRLQELRCLTCGERLAPSARECRQCGSARWTVVN